jgi:uncharacterized protein YdhG (YjbR/CyaY superfamily)
VRTKANSVAEYIEGFPLPTRKKLKELRALIRAAAPKATEQISYGMPAYKLNGPLVYFAGYAKHLGLYAANGTTVKQLGAELEGYKTSKGTIQFPLDAPLPKPLIKKILKLRVTENLAR